MDTLLHRNGISIGCPFQLTAIRVSKKMEMWELSELNRSETNEGALALCTLFKWIFWDPKEALVRIQFLTCKLSDRHFGRLFPAKWVCFFRVFFKGMSMLLTATNHLIFMMLLYVFDGDPSIRSLNLKIFQKCFKSKESSVSSLFFFPGKIVIEISAQCKKCRLEHFWTVKVQKEPRERTKSYRKSYCHWVQRPKLEETWVT